MHRSDSDRLIVLSPCRRSSSLVAQAARLNPLKAASSGRKLCLNSVRIQVMEEQQGEAGKADSNLSDDIKCGIQGVTHPHHKRRGGGQKREILIRETLFG